MRRHIDRYAHLAPGSGHRDCRRADGGPKRKLSEDAAHLTVELAGREGVVLHAYECPECACWHTATGPGLSDIAEAS